MRMRSALVLSFTLFLSIIVTGCKGRKAEPTLPPPVRVTVMAVGEGTDAMGRVYSATVSSSETTTVSFSTAGRIITLSAEEGVKISKGQMLGRIDDGDYVNAKNIAYAQLAEAQDGYERLKKLHDANALPDVKWVEMQQKLKQAQNAAEMADRTLKETTLISPVSGTVSRKFADVGQSVVPVQPIYEIVSTSQLEIDVPVAESDISKFYIGQPAKVEFEYPGLSLIEGKVKSKSVVADPLTRAYTVKISLPKTQGNILPGMLSSVTFEERDNTQLNPAGILLPSGSVLLDFDNRQFVWLVKDSVAQRRFVETDALVEKGILVTSGLSKGDTVIIAGMQKVGTGTKVVPLIK